MRLSEAVPIIEKTLADMKTLGVDDELPQDAGLYWMTPHGSTFDVSSPPGECEVGDISEEYESITARMSNHGVAYPDSLLLLSAMMRLAYESAGK